MPIISGPKHNLSPTYKKVFRYTSIQLCTVANHQIEDSEPRVNAIHTYIMAFEVLELA